MPDDQLTVDQYPDRFMQLVEEQLHQNAGDFEVQTSTTQRHRAAVVIRDIAAGKDLAVAWTPHRGLHFDTNPGIDEDGNYAFVGGTHEPMRSAPGPGDPVTPDFLVMVATNRLLDWRIDSRTLAQLGRGQFLSELAGRLMSATEGDEFTPEEDLKYGDSFEGFMIAHEQWGEHGLAVVLEDEDSGEEFAVGWSPDQAGLYFDEQPEVDEDEEFVPGETAELTAMGVETPIGEVVAAVLDRMRARRHRELANASAV